MREVGGWVQLFLLELFPGEFIVSSAVIPDQDTKDCYCVLVDNCWVGGFTLLREDPVLVYDPAVFELLDPRAGFSLHLVGPFIPCPASRLSVRGRTIFAPLFLPRDSRRKVERRWSKDFVCYKAPVLQLQFCPNGQENSLPIFPPGFSGHL